MKIAAYVYPGWHPCPERDRHFPPGFTEWDLVHASRPRFEGHVQPRLPRDGPYDDADPASAGPRLARALSHGIDVLVWGFFWCRGKRVLQEALDDGFLASPEGDRAPFALMWANRMPRRILPVKRADLPVIQGERLVDSDIRDFSQLVGHAAERYFSRPNYLRLGGKPYLSIYDSTFFVRELGEENAAEAVARAKRLVQRLGFPGLHLAAVQPAPGFIDRVRNVGFDSVTNYVLLPYWKGPFLQDYRETASRRAEEWPALAEASGLPYHPSVSPGWDASPRAADFGREKPRKYPWWPVVTGERPDLFREALGRAIRYAGPKPEERIVFIASLNEWSEGHYLEPDARFGDGWLEAVKEARAEGAAGCKTGDLV